MYQYIWDEETGGLLLTADIAKFSKEPRPVYYKELDILGFDRYWDYPKDDSAPLMWAEANNYIYKGRIVAKTKGGSIYTPPEIIILDKPEPDDTLEFVDIETMVSKNWDLLETLVQDTIQKVYNKYRRYSNRVDIFHVSFSGGKDSVVTLDIVQQAIPHNKFVVIFGDTGMEFPDTFRVIEETKKYCEENGIDFYTARSDVDPIHNWKVFGPPSTVIRWCCSVHKTTPQLLCLRDITGKDDIIEMAFVGVRGDESFKRSEYDYISYGTKHKGQYSCNPIIAWSSAEVYLYIYKQHLILNEAYKKGNSRVGCLVCPMAGDRHEYIRNQCYPEEVQKYVEIIKETNGREFPTQEDTDRFINVGGWKVRNNGRDIKSLPIKYIEKSATLLVIIDPFQEWSEWLKTLGTYFMDGNTCILKRDNETYIFDVVEKGNKVTVTLSENLVKNNSTVVKLIKQVFRKAAYCVACRECQADCPYGCLNFINGKISISDTCRHCLNCHKTPGGCLLYKSLEQPKGNGKMNTKAIDCYADHAPKIEWIHSFFELQDDFFEKHLLGSVMFSMFKRFLRDAELIEDNKLTDTARILSKIGENDPAFWGIMLVNLSHTPEVGWYVKNIPFDTVIQKDYLIEMLRESGAKERGAKSVSGAYRRILALPFGDMLGLGTVTSENRSFYLIRGHWKDPVAEVILYSLYKFAEACGGTYQFTLKYLLDDSIERDGVSPSRIFGLDRETMVRILKALSVNYPEFISASFTLDLDTITLRPAGSELTSEDVLKLFE